MIFPGISGSFNKHRINVIFGITSLEQVLSITRSAIFGEFLQSHKSKYSPKPSDDSYKLFDFSPENYETKERLGDLSNENVGLNKISLKFLGRVDHGHFPLFADWSGLVCMRTHWTDNPQNFRNFISGTINTPTPISVMDFNTGQFSFGSRNCLKRCCVREMINALFN